MGTPDYQYDPETFSVRAPAVEDVVELEYGEIDADDIEEAITARVPLSRNPRKAAYLANRAMGFSFREACHLAEITSSTVYNWRRTDPEFADWEANRLHELQKDIASDTMRMTFQRNMALALRRDYRVLRKAVYDFHGLTEREFDYLKLIRKHYTPQDLIALDRATQPEVHADNHNEFHGDLNIYVDGQIIEGEDAKRAATRQLLEKFTKNKDIEGQLVGTTDSD